MAAAGVDYIPSNTFSLYDQVLDTSVMLGAVPPRFGWQGGAMGLDLYFAMARGTAGQPAMEMTKWFDTNYHYIVPELAARQSFRLSSTKAVNEYKEAKAAGIETVPVLIGPITYLLVSKPARGTNALFDKLSLLQSILPIYREILLSLAAAGAKWVQLDEPALVLDLDAPTLEAYRTAYSVLGEVMAMSSMKLLLQTYFSDIPEEAYRLITSLEGVAAIGLDLVRGKRTLDLVHSIGLPADKLLFAGIVDGRNVWANDLQLSLQTLEGLQAKLGRGRVVVSTSSTLQHTAVDLDYEVHMDEELRSWMAFAKQKVLEIVALSRALKGQRDEAFFTSNAKSMASRKSSTMVTLPKVQEAVTKLRTADHYRKTSVAARLAAQQQALKLLPLPTTTIGSFPQTPEIRRTRRDFKMHKLTEEQYTTAIKEEIARVVRLQVDLDIDVLVHGEPERNDMVEYFGEQLQGFTFTENGWVQSYGSRCVKPPIIYGDVCRPQPMTVAWMEYANKIAAESMKPMKGMLTGPVTILNWSFVRDDQPRETTCLQVALAIRDEVLDLEAAGIQIIQIDEAALREGLPLRHAEQAKYLEWAVKSFRITTSGVGDATQIHTHMCYSNFNDIMSAIKDMDADVITIENSRSDEKLLEAFSSGGATYAAGIGPGVYDIHSPRVPATEEMVERLRKIIGVLDPGVVWVNPDCGLKTRKYEQVLPALQNMVAAAKLVRAEL
eukprot:SM000056S17912  [mRNA]  locus=s56:33908:38318:- [translate_table: standard]